MDMLHKLLLNDERGLISMDVICRINENVLAFLGFERLSTDKRIKVYDGLTDTISISLLSDIRNPRIGKIFLDILSPEFKELVIRYLNNQKSNFVHFSEIDGIYYATKKLHDNASNT